MEAREQLLGGVLSSLHVGLWCQTEGVRVSKKRLSCSEPSYQTFFFLKKNCITFIFIYILVLFVCF